MHIAGDLLFTAAVVASGLATASAHRGLLSKPSCDADFGSSATALNIPDPSISWSFSHYADCSKRAVWSKFENKAADSIFYFGVGVPTKPRFSSLRAAGMIFGPGLPNITTADRAALPAEVRNDPLLSQPGIGSLGLERSPADQSTCAHLSPTMFNASTVRNGRCDFFEPYGQTHSWRILDKDFNTIPLVNQTYYVVIFLETHTSGKFGIALGTWTENFRAPLPSTTPSCVRDLRDFSEKGMIGGPSCYPPMLSCPVSPAIPATNCDTRASSPTPAPAPPPIAMSMSIPGDVAALTGNATVKAAFETAFKTDIAAALSIEHSRIAVTSITAGSVVVAFTVAPKADGTQLSNIVASTALNAPITFNAIQASTVLPTSIKNLYASAVTPTTTVSPPANAPKPAAATAVAASLGGVLLSAAALLV